jgi:hypothetical protein
MSQPTDSARPRAKKKPTDHRQLIVTLNARDGDVVKIEELEESGGRHEIMDEEFAVLAGDAEAASLFPALEHAYVAGFADADGEGFSFDDDDDDDDIEQFLMHGVGAHPFLRHEVRRLILGRLIRRQLSRPAKSRATDETGHEGEESGREERKAKTEN